jgi:hypothetical protein
VDSSESSQGSPFGCIFTIAILALALYGGYTAYNRTWGNSDCSGATAWYNKSAERSNAAVRRATALDPYSMSPRDAKTEAIHFQQLALTQIDSAPPPAGQELNAAMVTYYQMLHATWNASSTGDRPPFSESQLTEQAETIMELEGRFRTKCS